MTNKTNNTSLFKRAVEELVDESFGGASGGGAGSFSHTQTTGHKTWSPGSPPFRGMTGSPGGLNVMDIAKESEEFAKDAGKNKPFPIEQIDEHLADAFININNAILKLESCIKYNKVLTKDKEKKVLLDHSLKKLIAVKVMIKRVANDVDRITLS